MMNTLRRNPTSSLTEWISVILVALLMLTFVVTFNGCNGSSTVGNGRIDTVEAATIRVAVGLAFAAKPNAIAPAYAVSTALLAMSDPETGKIVTVAMIREAIGKEAAKLKLDPATAASFADLVGLIEAKIAAKLAETEIPATARIVLIRDVLAIVQEAAAARMPPLAGPAPAP